MDMRNLWEDPTTYRPELIKKSLRDNPDYSRGIYYLGTIFTQINELIELSWQDGNRAYIRKLTEPFRELTDIAADILEQPLFSSMRRYLPDFPSSLDHDDDFYLDRVKDFMKFITILEGEYRECGQTKYQIPRNFQSLIKKVKNIIEKDVGGLEEHLVIGKTYIQRCEATGKLSQPIPITKREYQLLNALHKRNSEIIEYKELNKEVRQINRANSNDDGRNRIIQIYKSLKKKVGSDMNVLIEKRFEGLRLICKSRKANIRG